MSPRVKGRQVEMIPLSVPTVVNENVERQLEENVVDNVEVNFLFKKGA